MEKIMECFKEEAENWDKKFLHGSLGLEFISTKEKEFVDAAFREDRMHRSILDVGIGTGRFSGILKEKSLGIYGLDLSEKMLKQTRTTLGKDARLVLGNAESMPFKNECFDGLVCIRVFQYFGNPKKAMEEFSRVCKTNSLIVFSICNKNSLLGLGRMISNVFKSKCTGWIDVAKLYAFKEIRKELMKSNIVIIGTGNITRIPLQAYIRVDNKTVLNIFKIVEKLADFMLGRNILYNSSILLCRKK
jgi:ubiquinone/menaquinone biosynthesis C-methylase UbiE